MAACSPTPSTVPFTTAPPPAPISTVQSPSASAATHAPTPIPSPASQIVAGAVDRSSLAVSATYDVDLDLAVASGSVAVATVIQVRNDSGGPIDRLELNTIAARLGDLAIIGATVDAQPVAVAIEDQTLFVPLGGILPDGAAATVRLGYAATLTADLEGSDWLFSRAGGTLALYRWIPWVSRAVPFDRPNHGDPFVTPSSPRVRVRVTTDVPMVLASPGATPVQERPRLVVRDSRCPGRRDRPGAGLRHLEGRG